MKTIVLGFSNREGSGPATYLAGPEVSRADAYKFLTEGKAQKFPPGIKRVEFHPLSEHPEIAILLAEPPAAEPSPTTVKSKSTSKTK